MEVYERINSIIKEQNITKREFANRLIALEPKLKSTGETPIEKTIYKYLNGTIAIKIELIPYIAEVLRVTEQDLFTGNLKSRRKFFLNIIKTADEEEVEILKEKFNLNYEKSSSDIQKKNNLQDELISLLPYAPKPLLHTIITKLKDIKKFTSLV